MVVDETAPDAHSDMDYAEHNRTYALFITMFKWGTVFSIACVILLALLTL